MLGSVSNSVLIMGKGWIIRELDCGCIKVKIFYE